MEIRNFFDKINLREGAVISLSDALKYSQNEKYQNYSFPVEEKKGEVVCVVRKIKSEKENKSKEEQTLATTTLIQEEKPTQVKETKTKRNPNFIDRITGKGDYQGIDRKVRENRINRQVKGQKKTYNNWQDNVKKKHYKTFEVEENIR